MLWFPQINVPIDLKNLSYTHKIIYKHENFNRYKFVDKISLYGNI